MDHEPQISYFRLGSLVVKSDSDPEWKMPFEVLLPDSKSPIWSTPNWARFCCLVGRSGHVPLIWNSSNASCQTVHASLFNWRLESDSACAILKWKARQDRANSLLQNYVTKVSTRYKCLIMLKVHVDGLSSWCPLATPRQGYYFPSTHRHMMSDMRLAACQIISLHCLIADCHGRWNTLSEHPMVCRSLIFCNIYIFVLFMKMSTMLGELTCFTVFDSSICFGKSLTLTGFSPLTRSTSRIRVEIWSRHTIFWEGVGRRFRLR